MLLEIKLLNNNLNHGPLKQVVYIGLQQVCINIIHVKISKGYNLAKNHCVNHYLTPPSFHS